MSTQHRTFIAAAMSFAVALAAAVFVVAVSGPAAAQVAPKTLLDLAESGCVKAQNFTSCASSLFDDYETDWEAAARLMMLERAEVKVSPFNIFCHTVAHELGKRAGAEGPVRFSTWSMRCEGGFIHGVLADQLGGSDVDELIDGALPWCKQAADVDGVVASCAHIVGHELWSRAGGSFDLADRCADLRHPDPAAAAQRDLLVMMCRGGLYMEYYQLPENQQRWSARGPDTPTKELLGPCLSLTADTGRPECLAMAFPALVISSDADDALGKGRDGLARCAELDPSDHDDCVIGVVGITYYNSAGGVDDVLPMCMTLGDDLSASAPACVRQLAISVERRTLSLDDGLAVCAAGPEPGRETCAAFVEEWHQRNVVGDGDGTAVILGAM